MIVGDKIYNVTEQYFQVYIVKDICENSVTLISELKHDDGTPVVEVTVPKDDLDKSKVLFTDYGEALNVYAKLTEEAENKRQEKFHNILSNSLINSKLSEVLSKGKKLAGETAVTEEYSANAYLYEYKGIKYVYIIRHNGENEMVEFYSI